jgi:radical SAM-linked protein
MRARIRFSKLGKIKFTSHRDVARIWERGLRRAALPVSYTEGFSPRPRLSFGLALSTGHESLGEYLDVELRPDLEIDCEQLPALLDPALPTGMEVQAARPVARSDGSLQQLVTSCSWRIEAVGLDPAALSQRVEAALAADALPISRQRKGNEVTDDVRPAILSVAVAGEGERGTVLVAELATQLDGQPRGLRPAELLTALDPSLAEGRVIRTHQWTQIDGARCEPIELAGATTISHASTAAPPGSPVAAAEARAS